MEQASASGTREALMERRAAPYPYSKMCELCELCELLERKIPPLCDGIFLFIRSRIYSLAFDSWNARRAIGTATGFWNRAAGSTWNGPPLTRGVRGVFLMSDIVRLLQRAEEGCEGLKHGYYDLPCVYFLIFLCHDIKNKIDRLLF